MLKLSFDPVSATSLSDGSYDIRAGWFQTGGALYLIARSPAGYLEAAYVDVGSGPGQYNVTLRRIVALTFAGVPSTIRVGDRRYADMRCTETLDTGEADRRFGNSTAASQSSHIRAGNDGALYIEGLSPGVGTVTCSRDVVTSNPVSVEVIP